MPWNTGFTEDIIKSPFTLAFERIGIPGSGTVINLVVLTAVLSVLNSISLGVILVAYGLRKAFGPTQRDPEQVVREAETRSENE